LGHFTVVLRRQMHKVGTRTGHIAKYHKWLSL